MKNKNFSRRNFLKKSAITTGAAAIGSFGMANNSFATEASKNKLPREVWIAGISQEGLYTQTPQLMIDEIFRILKDVVIYQPDIICLPEVFATQNVKQKTNLSEKLEISEKVVKLLSGFAKENNCNIVCPVYTAENGKVYNSAVVLNRRGESLGEYRKIHLTESEIETGKTPGPMQPPVFQTDVGKIGIQICFDMNWDDGWAKLRELGAEVVFFPSAFAAGQMVNARAWKNKYVVVSSTNKHTSKMCDITGEVVAQTGNWDKNFFCAPVNLEKVFLHTWPYVKHYKAIKRKYGRRVQITHVHEEGWSVIESLAPEIFVADILNEFGIKTHEQHIHDADVAQIKARKA